MFSIPNQLPARFLCPSTNNCGKRGQKGPRKLRVNTCWEVTCALALTCVSGEDIFLRNSPPVVYACLNCLLNP
jgi:hypothetical protein